MAKSFLHLLAQHIGEAFGDLSDYFGNQERFTDTLASLGWEVGSLPNSYTAIATEAATLRQLINNMSSAPSIADTLDIIDSIKKYL